jgi:glycyl-tRNA synthetase beta chain
MSEFFLELFSEEIPANLQKVSRTLLLENFKKLFLEKGINFNKSETFSTPNRLIILFKDLPLEIIQKEEEIKGPNVNAPEKAIEGFLRSNEIDEKVLFKKNLEKGEFYFYKKPSNKINTATLLEEQIPRILDKLQWKKSMRWGKLFVKLGKTFKINISNF